MLCASSVFFDVLSYGANHNIPHTSRPTRSILMPTHHLEVIPRIIDTTIAATYQAPPKASVDTPSATSSDNPPPKKVAAGAVPIMVPLTFTDKFFMTLKDIMVPACFLIAVIAFIYVLWKYWTTYRTNESEVQPAKQVVAEQPTILPAQPADPENESLSKYIIRDDVSSDAASSVRGKLSTIGEGDVPELSEDSECDEDSGEEEEEEDASDAGSDVSDPDFGVIKDLINQPMDEYASDRFEYLNDDVASVADSIHTEIDMDEMHTSDHVETDTPSKSPRRARKGRRAVL